MRANEARATVGVVGAGIVGACIALALRKRGADVTLIDRDEPGRGCSFGNSGAISPSSVAPMAMPGMLKSAPRMLIDADGPLYLPLRYLPSALPWLARFVASASAQRVADSERRLAALHANAVERHVALAYEVGVPELALQRGHLHVYPDAASLGKDAAIWRTREARGYVLEQFGRDGIEALEPGVGARYRLGVFVADHATIVNPFRYVQAIVRAFASRGGRLVRAHASGLVRRDDRQWTVHAGAETLAFDHVVVAAGAWSRALLDPLGVRLPLESQRGYHVQFTGAAPITRTVVLADRKIFATPMEDGLRVGGTVEIAGLAAPPDARRADILHRAAVETFAPLRDAQSSRWMGHRPCMPDSVPVVGRVGAQPHLYVAVGHGHLGLTDSPHTAEIIADAVLDPA